MRDLKTAFLIVTCWVALNESGAEQNASSNSIPVIRVTALRFNDLEMGVPANVQVITAEQIEKSHFRSIPDLLQNVANVRFRSVTGTGKGGQLAMRGFGENSGLRVLVLVDGQKINRADMGGIDWQQLPLNDIESIEVIRGSQTVLYGHHALSGVIKITTRKGGEPKLKLNAEVGSFGFEEYGASYSAGTNRFFYDVGATVQRESGYRDNSASHSKNIHARIGRYLGDYDTLTFRISGGKTYQQFPGPLTYLELIDDPTQSSNLGNEFFNSDNISFTTVWETDRDWGIVSAEAGFTQRDIEFEQDGTSGTNKQQGFFFSPQMRLGDSDQFISGGLDLRYDTIDFDGDQGVTFNHADLHRLTPALFLFARQPVSDQLTLSGGVRLEQAETSAKNNSYNTKDKEPFIPNPWGPPLPNPNYPPQPIPEKFYDENVTKQGWGADLSLSWQATETLNLWAGYDRIYHYPALDEVAVYQGFDLPVLFNKNLDPETGHNFEIGAKYRDKTWSASATLFYMTLYGEIAYDATEKQNANIGDTTRFGADLDLEWTQDNYGLSTHCSLVRAEFDGGPSDGNRIPLVPELYTTTSAWLEPVESLHLRATHQWTASQFEGGDKENDDPKMDAYHLVDLSAELAVTPKLKLFFKVENLFDKQYVSSAYNGGYYPGNGRGFYGGLNLEL